MNEFLLTFTIYIQTKPTKGEENSLLNRLHSFKYSGLKF